MEEKARQHRADVAAVERGRHHQGRAAELLRQGGTTGHGRHEPVAEGDQEVGPHRARGVRTPGGVDGVEVHAHEVGGLRDVLRAEAAVVRQGGDVDAQGDRDVGRVRLELAVQEPAPQPPGVRGWGPHEDVRLVGQVPRPQGRMVADGLGHRLDQADLGPQHAGIRVGAPTLAPGNVPVLAAHVAGEEGGDDAQADGVGQVAELPQPFQGDGIDAILLGLEVGPAQEEPDHLASRVRQGPQLAVHGVGIPPRPHRHALATRPVVDAQQETAAQRLTRTLHGVHLDGPRLLGLGPRGDPTAAGPSPVRGHPRSPGPGLLRSTDGWVAGRPRP